MKTFAHDRLCRCAIASTAVILLLTGSPVRAQTACTGDIVSCPSQYQTQPAGGTQTQSTYNPGYGTATSPQGGYTQSGYGQNGYSQPGYGQSQPGYGNAGYSSGASASGFGTGSSAVQSAPASALGQRGGSYGSSGGYGSSGYGQNPSSLGAIQAPVPQGAQATGPCTAHLLDDRSTIALSDAASGSDRSHVALGQDRVQQLFKSADGAWAVAVFKVRGQPQYGALVFDLAACAQSASVSLPDTADAAQFDGTQVALTLHGGSGKNVPLSPVSH